MTTISGETGRIVYFEPNELFGENNIPVNQEDLNKYINLSVRVPSRFYNESDVKRKYESVLAGTSFEEEIDGKKYTKLYLTDNYVNMSYTEFSKNGEVKNGELFGIDYINISFDVQFQPIVVIRFTDVKGFGLMSTMQYNYENDKIKDLTAKSFFTSLFNFPYPIFTLEVKGYYGKSISFDLALKDFHTAFDSTTGDFKTTVSFIGHLYGVYGDIPMPLLLISPYIDCQGINNIYSSSNLEGQTWKDLGNDEIPTYLKFLTKYSELLLGEGIGNDILNDVKTSSNLRKEVEKLEEIKLIYENIIYYAEDQLKSMTYKEDGLCFVHKTNGYKSLYDIQKINNLIFFEPGSKITILVETGNTLYNKCSFYGELQDKIKDRIYEDEYNLGFNKMFETIIQKDCQIKYQGFTFTDIFTKLSSITETINTLNTTIEGNISREISSITYLIAEKIGFPPTIKNIYKILFKHLECFSKQFYNVIKDINVNRNATSSSNGQYIESVNGKIPPFPLAYKEEKGGKKIIYPGEINNFVNSPEISFVEKINDSVNYFSQKMGEASQKIISAREISGNDRQIYGTLYCDWINPGISNYYALQRGDEKPNTAEQWAVAIRDMFLARLNTFGKLHYLKNDDAYNEKYFIEKETLLLYNSNPHIEKNVITNLSYFNTDELFKRFNELSGGTNWGFVTFPYGSNTEETNDGYKQIHKNEDYKTSVIIFIQGTKTSCSDFISNNFNENYRHIFPSLDYKNINGYKVGWGVNKYKVASYCTKYKSTTIAGSRPHTSYTCKENFESEYITGDTPYYSTTYGEYNPLISWATTKYSHEMCEVYLKNENGGGTFDYECSEGEKTTTRSETNRIVLINLAQLLGIGEMFYYKGKDDYKIPITIKTKDEYSIKFPKKEKEIFEYYKKCEGENIFKELTIGLYKVFFGIGEGKDNDYYSYFNIPTSIKTLNDACDYWFVIAKNFEYSDGASFVADKENLNKIWNDFVKNIKNVYGFDDNNVNNNNNIISGEKYSEKDKIFKTNIYYTLKTLYDKWFSGLPSNHFDMNREDSEFNKIEYITTTFNDISDELFVDVESFANQILSIKINSEDSPKSVLSFMASTAQNNLSTFIVLPTKIFDDNLEDAFRTFNFYDGGLKHDNYGSTYIVMYNGDVSHNLDIADSEYGQDGYNIADYYDGVLKITEDATNVMALAAEIEGKTNHKVKAFGVTYGMQNQNFFKNININTETPQMTDYSIANMLKLAGQGSDMVDGGQLFTSVQSLYPTYANRSYNCSVEMMGCMNITPLMYFQLNNIPMFKGAYIITKVEHTITPNDFVTTFTGVRVSKYNIPINKSAIDISRINSIIDFINEPKVMPNIEENKIVNVINNNDTVNLDSGGTSCFIGYNYNCSGIECDCHRSANLSIKCLLDKNKVFAYDESKFANPETCARLLYEDRGSLYYFLNSGETPQDKYDKVVSAITHHLDCGCPVIVGVNHTYGKKNSSGNPLNEGTTDHWVVIYAYGTSNDLMYFRYFETGSNYLFLNNREDIFIYEPGSNPKLFNNKARPENTYSNRRYDISVVKFYHDIETINLKLQNYHNGRSISNIEYN